MCLGILSKYQHVYTGSGNIELTAGHFNLFKPTLHTVQFQFIRCMYKDNSSQNSI